MDWERRCLRLCAAVLLTSVLLRFLSSGVGSPLLRLLHSDETLSFCLYLQTGRVVRLDPDPPEFPVVTFTPTKIHPSAPAVKRPSFSPSDAALVPVLYNCDYSPDLESLITAPLEWDLTKDGPAVLILHTHTTECYTPAGDEEYKSAGDYRTLDPEYNMLCLGNLIARRLEEAGISVIHDTALHDYPSYNDSYSNAAASTEGYLERYPSIRLILDLHRDAADTAYGQMVTQCSVGSQTAAQLMFVVGTDGGGLNHPDWEQNLALALKLQVLLEREAPGICRNLNLTRHRYNQHLGEHALLIEIGAAGNVLAEARLAAEQLAQAIIGLKYGSR